MATTVDTLLVRIEADLSDVQKSLDKLDKDMKRATTGAAASFNKLGTAIKAIAGAVIVQQLARAGASAVLFAADIQEMQSKSQVVFGAFRGDVVDALSEFGDQVGRSRFELEGMASTLQDTFVPLGFAREQASKLSVEMTKLAVDVASFNNASDVETMQAFQSALVGNHETVRRFGIIITEATLNQELMRMGIEKGTKAATEQQKVMARMNLIMNGVTDAQGDAARTADSFANQLKAAQANTQELSNAIGVALMPIATELLGTFNDLTTSILNAGIAMGVFAATPEKKLGIVKDELSEITRTLALLDAMAGATDTSGRRSDMIGFIANNYGDREGAEARVEELRQQKKALEDEVAAIKATSEAAKQAARDMQANGGGKTSPTKAETETANALKNERTELAALSQAKRQEFKLERDLKLAISEGNKERIKQAHFNQILYDLKKEFPELTKAEITTLTDKARIEADLIMKEQELTDHLDAKKKALDDYNASAADGLSYVLSNIRTNQELEETLKDLTAARQSQTISELEYIEAQKQIEEKIRELDPVYQNMKDSAQQVYDDMSNALTEMVMSGQVNLNNLGKMFKQTINQMIADAVRSRVIKPMLNSAFSMAGSFLGASGNPLLQLAGTALGAIGGSADGGNLNAYTPQIVGERGPELIVPKTASTIKNHHNTMNALGGGGGTIVNQTINVSAGVSQTVKTEMMALLPRFKQDTMAAVVDAKRRGGSFGQAFG